MIAAVVPVKALSASKSRLLPQLGAEGARRLLDDTTASAIEILEPFGARGNRLIEAARFIASRTH